jgi:predicted ATPase/transcriptional regulator with XRE-family HTH domain
MDVGAFGSRVQEYLRGSGYTQKDLANELGLHPKVLSRKLHGSSDARLTQMEVRRIITTLARWQAIATHDEAHQLLELVQMQPTSFSIDEWQSPPLSQLAAKSAQPLLSSDFIHEKPALRHNLPAPVTRLIGREWAVERLRTLLGRDEVRLVTLIGPGGSGKTRLAIHVAGELADAFAHGVCYVGLSGVHDPSHVPMCIVQGLGMTPAPNKPLVQSLITHLHEKQVLLVLDNFEQVAQAASTVSELLAAVPGLKVLVTSRVVLHLYGEREFSVPPLDVPDPSAVTDTEELGQYAAIQLFIERAQAAVPEFDLTVDNAESIAQVCAKLDGLPLALELAAARIKVLPPAQLLERLSGEGARLAVLARGVRGLPSRQRTLRNTITWSYNLLAPQEQQWFARLGVFAGGWSFEAAEALLWGGAAQRGSPAHDSLLEMLAQLVDNSLVVRHPVAGGQMRFLMLETLREYALERLVERGELEWLRDRHACYYLEMAEAAEVGLRGAQQLSWLARLGAERKNVRAALEWSLQRARAQATMGNLSNQVCEATQATRDAAGQETQLTGKAPEARLDAVEVCLRLVATLRPYWEWQGYLTEGREWLEAALALAIEEGAAQTVRAARAKALSEAARVAVLQNEQTRAVELAEASIELWQQLDDPSGLVIALLHRGWVANAQSDNWLAKRMYEQGLQLLSPTGDKWLRAQLLFYLGAVAGLTADFEQMQSFYAESRRLFEEVGDKSLVANVMKDQGAMSLLEGNYTEAIICLLKSIESSYELGHRQIIASALGLLGFAIGLSGEPDAVSASLQAAQLFGAAASLQDAIGFTPWMLAIPVALEAYQQICARVDKQSWKEASAAGRALSEEQAITLAYQLGEISPESGG